MITPLIELRRQEIEQLREQLELKWQNTKVNVLRDSHKSDFAVILNDL
jgi:hypothetical protein